MPISELSTRSLMLYPIFTRPDGIEEKMASATGFVVEHESQHYLITNWHVVSGRNADNGQPISQHGGLPNRIEIWHREIGMPWLMKWIPVIEELVDPEDSPRWLEHPDFGRTVDAVALPLSVTGLVDFHPYDLTDGSTGTPVLDVDVPDPVNIIGFPFGKSAAARIAIWARGFIASDMEIDYGYRPCFLVDSRTREGQSGSPVVAYKGLSENARLTDGSIIMGVAPMNRLLGVYSGRINQQSDIGRVWKISAIKDIIERGISGNRDLVSPFPPPREPQELGEWMRSLLSSDEDSDDPR